VLEAVHLRGQQIIDGRNSDPMSAGRAIASIPTAKHIASSAVLDENTRRYDLIVIDVLNSDSVPTHLLTREAFNLYQDKLADHGIIAVHLTNRYLDLEPVVYEAARATDLQVRSQLDNRMSPAAMARAKQATRWAILARRNEDFRELQADLRWRPLCRKKVSLWTDDYSNIAGILDFASR
jgi:spermidine synthase